jgi:hypothetical protein
LFAKTASVQKYLPRALTVDFLMLKRVEQRKCHRAQIGTLTRQNYNFAQSQRQLSQGFSSKLDILAQ